MHQLIYALVQAADERQALRAANWVFETVVDETDFDWYQTFETDAPRERWGDELPVAASVESDQGKEVLGRAWNATATNFERNLRLLEEKLEECSMAELMACQTGDACAFALSISELTMNGPGVYLYNSNSEGIRGQWHLRGVLEDSENLWIVPADAHW